jgi:phospholipase/carboxylesterase
MAELLPCVEVGPASAVASVVWLHGLGASGHDFEDVVPLLELPQVRFVFPHAPQRAVTLNMGLIMPAWYDILSLGGGVDDERGIRDSARHVEALLEREQERGVAVNRIVIAGFSQGGAIALHAGTRYAKTLAGIMLLSGYEVLADTREAEASAANRATPLLGCHGSLDPMVSLARGRAAYDAHAAGRPAAWHAFPMAHAVCLDEIHVIGAWLAERLAPAT